MLYWGCFILVVRLTFTFFVTYEFWIFNVFSLWTLPMMDSWTWWTRIRATQKMTFECLKAISETKSRNHSIRTNRKSWYADFDIKNFLTICHFSQHSLTYMISYKISHTALWHGGTYVRFSLKIRICLISKRTTWTNAVMQFPRSAFSSGPPWPDFLSSIFGQFVSQQWPRCVRILHANSGTLNMSIIIDNFCR